MVGKRAPGAGRPKVPTQIKIAQGNRSRRKEDVDPTLEPQPEKLDDLSPPDFLTKEAKAEWDAISPYLRAQNLLTVLDKNQLTMLCQSWGRWVKLEKKLTKYLITEDGDNDNFTVYTEKGNLSMNPYVKAIQAEMTIIGRFLREFGMTPSARAGLTVGKVPEDPADLWQKFSKMSRLKGGAKS